VILFLLPSRLGSATYGVGLGTHTAMNWIEANERTDGKALVHEEDSTLSEVLKYEFKTHITKSRNRKTWR
jgi:hypothetical protein